MSSFDMLRLGVVTLADAGGDPEPFLRRIDALQERLDEIEIEAARLQQEIYEAVQAAWREGKS